MSTLSHSRLSPSPVSWPPVAEPEALAARYPMEETLVADARAGLTPSQMVERKLLSLLDGQAAPVRPALLASPYRYPRQS
jgi:hypothetical protein